MTEYNGPLPKPDRDSAVYWDAARRHELVLQRCNSCHRFRFYPRSVCPHCLSDEFEWQTASGRGHIYSFTVIHRSPSPAFRDRVPYVLALVELEEGVRMMTNIVGCDPEAVAIGEAVEVTFDDVTDEVTLPKFRLATADRA